MAKTFLYSIGVLILINLIIKTGLYLSYYKTVGTVTNLYASTIIKHTSNKTYCEKTVVPTVEYIIAGKKYSKARAEWGFPGGYEIGEKVELLYGSDKDNPELNRFFQYWLKLSHLAVITGLGVLLTVIIQTVSANKKS